MFVASTVPASGLENTLPAVGRLPSDEAVWLVSVLWHGSKQAAHPRIGSARRGVRFCGRRRFVLIIGKQTFDTEQGHDMSRDYEYTDWDAAERLANDVDQLVGSVEQS